VSATTSNMLQAVSAALLLATGLRMTFKPRAYRDQGIQNNDRAIAERLKRGHDRYFEELRTLRAYSQPRPIRTIRIFGIALILLSLTVLSLYLFA